MEFISCASLVDYLTNDILVENWCLVLGPGLFNNYDVTRYKTEKPIKRWVRPDGLQKWVIGEAILSGNKGLVTISMKPDGLNEMFHEATQHTFIGQIKGSVVLCRSTNQARIDYLNIMVNELEVKLKNLSEDSVRMHDTMIQEQMRSLKLQDSHLEDSRLITILRERISNRDSEILKLKEDKASVEKRLVEIDTSLQIANESIAQAQATRSNANILQIGWPLSATDLRVTANPRVTICKQDVCIGSYILSIVEPSTANIVYSHWFSVEINTNTIKKMLVRWMNGFHPTAVQNGSAIMRQMPSYNFKPQDILDLISTATGSNFILTGYTTIKECDWLL